MRSGEFAELQAFLATDQELSFRRAAARLRLSPSAVSQSVRQLEERLGARLLNRTTRSVALTEAGRDLLARLGPALARSQARWRPRATSASDPPAPFA